MMCIVTKATAIQCIDSKCHIMKQKSCKTVLFGYYACVSCDLLLMALGMDTHTHTYRWREQKQFQETRHARPSAARAWFKKSEERILYFANNAYSYIYERNKSLSTSARFDLCFVKHNYKYTRVLIHYELLLQLHFTNCYM